MFSGKPGVSHRDWSRGAQAFQPVNEFVEAGKIEVHRLESLCSLFVHFAFRGSF